MKYRLTCLTPTLVGDGFKLSPIDYMVWKDHINVLDQGRIFRLLAKGPRLDNYLKQIQRADRLDFASWGGFAQNFAARRLPFEHPAYTRYWEKLPPELLHIPTFFSGPGGPFLPGSALKGALRTGVVHAAGNAGVVQELAARENKDRPPRHPGLELEDRTIGRSTHCRLKVIAPSDSAPVATSSFKIYMVRTATLGGKPPDRLELRWKTAPSGSVEARRLEDSTPVFAEMAAPGTVFEGYWSERGFYRTPEIAQALRWKGGALATSEIFRAANDYSSAVLASHKLYARATGLGGVVQTIEQLESRLNEARTGNSACLLGIGWGGGFLGKVASASAGDESYRQVLGEYPFYSRAIRAGLPFPKTRRIVFLENKPAALPGWVLLETTG